MITRFFRKLRNYISYLLFVLFEKDRWIAVAYGSSRYDRYLCTIRVGVHSGKIRRCVDDGAFLEHELRGVWYWMIPGFMGVCHVSNETIGDLENPEYYKVVREYLDRRYK